MTRRGWLFGAVWVFGLMGLLSLGECAGPAPTENEQIAAMETASNSAGDWELPSVAPPGLVADEAVEAAAEEAAGAAALEAQAGGTADADPLGLAAPASPYGDPDYSARTAGVVEAGEIGK